VSPKVRRESKSAADFSIHSQSEREQREKRFDGVLESISLKDVPLEERRKEAEKPLYLTRYE
jgi:hypothetical protein